MPVGRAGKVSTCSTGTGTEAEEYPKRKRQVAYESFLQCCVAVVAAATKAPAFKGGEWT